MSSIKALESRLTLTCDPGPMIAGLKRADEAAGSWVQTFRGLAAFGIMGEALGLARSAITAIYERSIALRDLATEYNGAAAAAKAYADVAELKRDIALGNAAAPMAILSENMRAAIARHEEMNAGAMTPGMVGMAVAQNVGGALSSANNAGINAALSPAAGVGGGGVAGAYVAAFLADIYELLFSDSSKSSAQQQGAVN